MVVVRRRMIHLVPVPNPNQASKAKRGLPVNEPARKLVHNQSVAAIAVNHHRRNHDHRARLLRAEPRNKAKQRTDRALQPRRQPVVVKTTKHRKNKRDHPVKGKAVDARATRVLRSPVHQANRRARRKIRATSTRTMATSNMLRTSNLNRRNKGVPKSARNGSP